MEHRNLPRFTLFSVALQPTRTLELHQPKQRERAFGLLCEPTLERKDVFLMTTVKC